VSWDGFESNFEDSMFVSWGTRATSHRTHSTLLLLQNRVEWQFTLHC